MPRHPSTRRDWLYRITLGTLAITTIGPGGLALAPAPALAQTKTQTPPEKTTEPVPRPGTWMKTHERYLERVKQGRADLVFLGDSITAGWGDDGRKGNGQEVWKRLYSPRNAVNLGIGGDRTQHVLWRIENGEVDGINPKALVLMIGTNNVKDNSAQEIADGITAIVRRLREKLPQTKILLLGVFPRGENPGPAREKLAEVNEKIKSLADGRTVVYRDIGRNFVNNDDGTISKEIMPDFLHLSPKGYEIWADAIESMLAKMVD
jgi:beta-glucosidase